MWVVAALYVGFRHFVLGGFAPSVARPELTWWHIVLSAIALVGGYLQKLVWPLHLSAFYVFHESQHWTDGRVLAGIAGLLICMNVFAWLWQRARIASFAFIWMGATIAPVLNARWMPAGVFAERYLYLPSMGFCWLVGWAAVWAWQAPPEPEDVDPAAARTPAWKRIVPAALALLAIFYGIRTIRRNREWRSQEALFRRTLDEQPDAQLIRSDLGVIFWDRGDTVSAEREWLRALGPGHPYAPTLNNLGLLRSGQKRYAEAIALFQQAMALRPNYMDPYKNLANTYAEMGRGADADDQFQKAVKLDPLSSSGRNAYGHFLVDQHRPAEAETQFRLSAEADPNGEASENLGDILAAKGDLQGARKAYETAVSLNSFDSHARFGLAAVNEREHRVAEAIRDYRAGLETDPTNAEAVAAMQRLTSQTKVP